MVEHWNKTPVPQKSDYSPERGEKKKKPPNATSCFQWEKPRRKVTLEKVNAAHNSALTYSEGEGWIQIWSYAKKRYIHPMQKKDTHLHSN